MSSLSPPVSAEPPSETTGSTLLALGLGLDEDEDAAFSAGPRVAPSQRSPSGPDRSFWNSEPAAVTKNGRKRHRVAIVSDFFHPNVGGVEIHQYALAQALLARGHKVIVITHAYGDRTGVRWLTNGLKAYFLPLVPMYNQTVFPTIYFNFPLLRNILLRERIEIVHGHQAFSALCADAIVHGATLGLKTVFTDHSLFGFSDASSILMNKVLKFTLSEVDQVICVSHTSKENTVLRAALSPDMVSVIPNAINTHSFVPAARRTVGKVTIVILSRLVYRKGIDLLLDVIPTIARRWPNVHFIVGGDGPKRLALEEMREKYQLHDRVEMLGNVPHSQVRDVLVRGQIFLNCSLTEAFCIAIVEAAACGLMVVSTRVGGVPEVLPPHMIHLAEPVAESITERVERVIPLLKDVDPMKMHEEVRRMYSWDNVAARTEIVYDKISDRPVLPLIERFRRYYGCGPWAGKLFVCIVAVDYLIALLLGYLWPADEIDIAPDWPSSDSPDMQPRKKK